MTQKHRTIQLYVKRGPRLFSETDKSFQVSVTKNKPEQIFLSFKIQTSYVTET